MNTLSPVLTPAPSSRDHILGSLEARVVLTEYGDFECSYCGDAYNVLKSLLKKYRGEVALVFREFPLSMHEHAGAAAEAAEAAGSVGKFWEMHDQLYEHQDALSSPELSAYAGTIGISGSVVAEAIYNGTYRKRIDDDVRSGEASQVQGTPALFVNGVTFDQELSIERLSETIDGIIASA